MSDVPYQPSASPLDRFRQLLRHDRAASVITLIWLCVMAMAIWLHTARSIQPPIYDAYTYYFKARAVWMSGSLFHPFHLLSIQPTFRPPATVLMSYPFGFDPDFRPFYFRSVFLPVLLMSLAGLIASRQTNPKFVVVPYRALSAMFLATISMLYYFEPYDGGPPAYSHWGLVDCFLSGVVALASACGVRSLRQLSLKWSLLSSSVCVIAIFVKPSGAPLAAIIGALVSLGWLWQLVKMPRPRSVAIVKRCALHIASQILLLGGAVFCALHSDYLGPTNMAYGNQAIVVMRAELDVPLHQLVTITLGTLGPFFPLWLALTVLAFGYLLVRRGLKVLHPQDRFLTVSAIIVLIIGVWFWLYGSAAPTQVRYFVPFLCIAYIFLIGPFGRLLAELPAILKGCFGLLMVASVINISLLLLLPGPSLDWQLWSGVNVMAGTHPAAIAAADTLIAQTPATTPTVSVYSLTGGLNDAMFESEFDMNKLHSTVTSFSVRRPIDWQRPSTYRVEEILSSNYLLLDPTGGAATLQALPKVDVPNLDVERAVFIDWANHLDGGDGVQTIVRQPHIVLLKIVDLSALRKSLDALVKSYQWRDVFLEANRPVWWSEAAVAQAAMDGGLKLNTIHFQGQYQIEHAPIMALAGNYIVLKAWIRRDSPGSESGWAMLVHPIDASGKIIAQHDVALPSYLAPAGLPYWYTEVKISRPADATRLAIGIYRGTDHLLKSDAAQSDWSGTRALLDLPAQP